MPAKPGLPGQFPRSGRADARAKLTGSEGHGAARRYRLSRDSTWGWNYSARRMGFTGTFEYDLDLFGADSIDAFVEAFATAVCGA